MSLRNRVSKLEGRITPPRVMPGADWEEVGLALLEGRVSLLDFAPSDDRPTQAVVYLHATVNVWKEGGGEALPRTYAPRLIEAAVKLLEESPGIADRPTDDILLAMLYPALRGK